MDYGEEYTKARARGFTTKNIKSPEKKKKK
jgi:hypothetical protein